MYKTVQSCHDHIHSVPRLGSSLIQKIFLSLWSFTINQKRFAEEIEYFPRLLGWLFSAQSERYLQ